MLPHHIRALSPRVDSRLGFNLANFGKKLEQARDILGDAYYELLHT